MILNSKRRLSAAIVAVVAVGFLAGTANVATAQQKKPNILVIWGDDIGYWN
jgi:hypothetical protein